MEAEERPTKLRKLDTEGDIAVEATADTPLLSDPNATVPESLDTAPSHSSKPEEHTANVADHDDEISEDESEGGAGIEPQAEQNGELLAGKPMSKNQMKKLRKREEWEAARDYRKLKRKQKLQEKKARKRAAREEAAAEEQGPQNGDAAPGLQIQQQQPQPRPKFRRPIQVPVTILIDCGFDDLMMEKERISLGSQLTRSYSDNSRAPFQAHLVISSWGGQLKERFDTVLSKHYLNWKGVVFEEGDFVEAARKADEFMHGPRGGKIAGSLARLTAANGLVEDGRDTEHQKVSVPNEGQKAPVSDEGQDAGETEAQAEAEVSSSNTAENTTRATATATSTRPEDLESAQKDQPPPPRPTGETVYLTSDSPDTLTALSPYSTYIVGGLVDKNRHKGICYKMAKERGIKTAKLPIGEYLDMQSRKVLATNHVVEIMVRWLECGDWGEAFMKVIPKRKGVKLREGDQQDSPAGIDDNEVEEHNDREDQEDVSDEPIEGA